MSENKNYLSAFEEKAQVILKSNIPIGEGEKGSIKYVWSKNKALSEKMKLVESQLTELANKLLVDAKNEMSETEHSDLKSSLSKAAQMFFDKFTAENS